MDTIKDYPRYGQMVKGYRYKGVPITFNEYGWLASGQFPADCIAECASSGDVTSAVEYWQERLGFNVPRAMAISWLAEYGAWTRDEMSQMSDTDIACKVLWLACGDIRESGEWLGLVH